MTLKFKSTGLGLGNAALASEFNNSYKNYYNSLNNGSYSNSIFNSCNSNNNSYNSAMKTMSTLSVVGSVLGLVSSVAMMVPLFKMFKKSDSQSGQAPDGSQGAGSQQYSSAVNSAIKTANSTGDWTPVEAKVNELIAEKAANNAKLVEYDQKIQTADNNIKLAQADVITAEKDVETAATLVDSVGQKLSEAKTALSGAAQLPGETPEAFAQRKVQLQKNVDDLTAELRKAEEDKKEKETILKDNQKKVKAAQAEKERLVEAKKDLEKVNAKIQAEIDRANTELAKRGREIDSSSVDKTKRAPLRTNTGAGKVPASAPVYDNFGKTANLSVEG